MKTAVAILLLTIISTSEPSVALSPDIDPWPMSDEFTWHYIDAKGRTVSLTASNAGKKLLEINGEKQSVEAFIIITELDGVPIRREVYAKTDGDLLKLKLTQLVENLVTEFTPPMKIAGEGLASGDRWNYSGRATVTGTRSKAPAIFDVEASYRVIMDGTIRIDGDIRRTFIVESEITFFSPEGVAVYGGTESVQYILGIGPKRITQDDGFPRLAVLLQSFDLPGLLSSHETG
ncbi:hypothetical protein J7K50_09780 [bacterium]|nr:hypothetical protein [bacterium]